MKKPFAYALYMEHASGEASVAACATLEEIEEALRNAVASRWVGVVDAEIVETLAEDGWRVRVFACTAHRRGQVSTELQPFTRTAKVA
jgi:phosphopantothenate synthetase